ncbi:MAG TPA: TonB-dependent receptor [Rhodanobacteraceae bacterium]|nr:TonB-dependent receptor [Rhodanobacteraceae bacterium]
MRPTLIAVAIATVLGATAVSARAASTELTTSAARDVAAAPDSPTDAPKTLSVIKVTATLNRARNELSPSTGSSQYVIDQHAIQQMPLGASTPLNQVILQAPGVVQDSFGQLHVRGDHANLQYRIDGVILPESISGFGQTLDPRMIQSASLLDGALPAQYGERTAGVINITTKNGAQMGHGGVASLTGGSFGTVNPFASIWGSSGRWSWFLTANYLKNNVGIENPTPSHNPIHDHTDQVKGFGDLSYLVNDDTRLSFMFGVANNRFQIPNNPNQEPEFAYLGQTDFNSAELNERQRELTRFGVLSLQGKLGLTDYQVSLGQRFSGIHFQPDDIGDLMFNGVASAIDQGDRASTLQADFSTPLGERNTLRYGLYGVYDKAGTAGNSLVFPANDEGEQTSTAPFAIPESTRIVAKTWAAYIQDQWNISESWTINYGVRGDRYQAFGRSQSQLSPRLGMVWQATPQTTVHAGYSRYFTPPATELISAEDIALFDGTTNAVKNYGNNAPLSERSNYFDVGVQQQVGQHLTLGLDTYYRKVTDLQDEGQFGAALIYSTFNYESGRVGGAEFTANYNNGPVSAYFNLAYSKAMGKRVVTSQYNFDPDDLAYIYNHFIYLDHDQKLASSGGASYRFADGTVGANYLFGTGLRRDGLVPNGESMPDYFQLDLTVAHDFDVGGLGKIHTQLAVINALDHVYELRDGTGVGVGAPQFGPRRGFYLTVSKDF